MHKKPDKEGLEGSSLAERLERLYQMAEHYNEVDDKEINPSVDSLAAVSQRYQSPELIAKGGMKRVYKVYDARAKRSLALAMLRDDVAEDLRDPFIHEAWLAAQLDHPNIMTVHDVGVKAMDQPYFTMDLKKGASLRELIEKLHAGHHKLEAQYPLETLLQIFLKICDAIAYAHSVNILHLDLKPANIQVGEYGQVLVYDWGLGRILAGEDPQELDRMLFNPNLLGLTNVFGQFKGTPGYMAPEQWKEEGVIDERTDVYGLGAILYSLLTYLRPLSGSVDEVAKKTLAGEIVSPIMRSPERNIPIGLSAVVMKALRVDAAHRYASIDALRLEVERYLMGLATEAEKAGAWKQLTLFYRRNRRFCLTLLSSGFLFLIGATVAFWNVSEARRTAVSTLDLYEAGQSELEKMNYANTESIVKLAHRYHFQSDHNRAEATLLTALKKDPSNQLLLRELGVHYFILQRFDEAISYLERGIHRNDLICQLCMDLVLIKGKRDYLNVDQMVTLVRSLGSSKPLALRLVLHDQKHRFDLIERASIVEAYLRLINPAWQEGWFEYDGQSSSLRVGGAGLERLTTEQSILIGLHPRTLDLSGSDVKDLWLEIHTAVEYLDIRGVPMDSLWALHRFVHLKELVITPNQFSDEHLALLPDRILVKEREL